MISGIPIDIVFVCSVALIWFMLMYQFVLALGGYLYSRSAARERTRLDRNPVELPGVSVLVPAHNEELVIERTIEAILASDYPDDKIELIVLNDGSTDQTGAVLDQLAKKHKSLRVVHIPAKEGGKGKAAVLNRGLVLARYELIAIFDADNQPEKKSLRYL